MSFLVDTASVQGYEHARQGKNNQDFAGAATTATHKKSFEGMGDLICGVVSDGCSNEGKISDTEVGAKLLGRRFLDLLWGKADFYGGVLGQHFGGEKAIRFAIDDLVKQTIPLFLHMLGKDFSSADRAEIISMMDRYLMATMLGVVVDGQDAWVLACGDGIIHADWSVPVIESDPLQETICRVIDQNDAPHYPAYEWIPNDWLDKGERTKLDRIIYHFPNVRRLIIATDGAKRFVDEGRIEEIYELAQTPKALQRKLNSGHPTACPQKPRPEWRVSDDTSMVVIQRA